MRKLASKTVFKNTILEMLEHKSLENISVEELIGETGLARSTFYRHFIDKQDLMEYAFLSDYQSQVEEPLLRKGQGLCLEARIELELVYLARHRGQYRNALKSPRQNSLYDTWFKLAYENISACIAKPRSMGADGGREHWAARMMALSLVNMYVDYLETPSQLSPQEYGAAVADFILHGADALRQREEGRVLLYPEEARQGEWKRAAFNC